MINRTAIYLRFLLLLVAISALLLPPAASAGQLRASAVKINITPAPDAGLRLSGYPRDGVMSGINDSLWVRVVALDDGKREAFVVQTDLSGVSETLYREFVERLESETVISADQVLWTFTHTHSAPGLTMEAPNTAFTETVMDNVVSGIKKSRERLEPASIGMDFGRSFMNINRRSRYADGKVSLGRNPWGIVDREVGVVRIDRLDGTPIALLVNYACHGTALFLTNMQVSGDAPGAVSRYLEDKLGAGVPVLYLNGAAGNVDPVCNYYEKPRYHNFELDMLGVMLGKDVMEVFRNLRNTTQEADLEYFQDRIAVPRKPEEHEDQGPAVFFRISVLRINDIVFAGASGEIFTEIGINIKQMSPYARTMFVGYCNGSSGYLPTAASYAEGGYETGRTHATSQGELIFTHSVVELLRRMHSMNRFYTRAP